MNKLIKSEIANISEFFGECVADIELPKGWEGVFRNDSYVNDVAPSFIIRPDIAGLNKVLDLAESDELIVYIDHPNRHVREFPEHHRFSLYSRNVDGDLTAIDEYKDLASLLSFLSLRIADALVGSHFVFEHNNTAYRLAKTESNILTWFIKITVDNPNGDMPTNRKKYEFENIILMYTPDLFTNMNGLDMMRIVSENVAIEKALA
tara:strand:+ start:68 stop:685 length:618 start_codon:yes stop_codon:yes gene_type:complete